MKLSFGVTLGQQSTLPKRSDLKKLGELVRLTEDCAVEALGEAGVRRIWFGPGNYDLDRQLHDMTLFRDRIAPHFV